MMRTEKKEKRREEEKNNTPNVVFHCVDSFMMQREVAKVPGIVAAGRQKPDQAGVAGVHGHLQACDRWGNGPYYFVSPERGNKNC